MDAKAELLNVIKRIPSAALGDSDLLQQIIRSAVYIRQCTEAGASIDRKVAYPWPLAIYHPDWRLIYAD